MDKIKVYILASVVVILATALVMTKYELYSIEKECKKYKDNIHAQLNQAIYDKVRIETEQKAKYEKAKADYDADVDRLNRAIDRMRKPKVVPGDSGVPVAGSCPDSMPRTTTDSSVTYTELATRAGTCESSFYKDALETTLRCKRLIELVTP